KFQLISSVKEFLSKPTPMGIVESAALSLLSHIGDAKELGIFTEIFHNSNEPWRKRQAALMGLSKFSARFEDKRELIAAHLKRYAGAISPVRIIASLPDAWKSSLHPQYHDEFSGYINRKSY